jgi:hypothetical protein
MQAEKEAEKEKNRLRAEAEHLAKLELVHFDSRQPRIASHRVDCRRLTRSTSARRQRELPRKTPSERHKRRPSVRLPSVLQPRPRLNRPRSRSRPKQTLRQPPKPLLPLLQVPPRLPKLPSTSTRVRLSLSGSQSPSSKQLLRLRK